MNSVKETNGNGSRTWYQDKKIRIRNTRILDTFVIFGYSDRAQYCRGRPNHFVPVASRSEGNRIKGLCESKRCDKTSHEEESHSEYDWDKSSSFRK